MRRIPALSPARDRSTSVTGSCRTRKDGNRHIILVTATPHSGNEGAFRSLLEILNPAFANLPDDLTGRRRRSIVAC